MLLDQQELLVNVVKGVLQVLVVLQGNLEAKVLEAHLDQGVNLDLLDDQESQVREAELEKQEILEFESHLAAATSKVAITESNSILIPLLTTMDPR